MPIHRISLKNFKCFKETDVELSRITVLTGENSSGKSSLIYGILAPFQSNGFPFYLSPNGKYVNMGDFRNISFNNSINNEIEIDTSGYLRQDEGDYNFKTIWEFDKNSKMPVLKQMEYDHFYIDGCQIKKDKDKYLITFTKNADYRKFEIACSDQMPEKERRRIQETFELVESPHGIRFKNLDDIQYIHTKLLDDAFVDFSQPIYGYGKYFINFIGPFRLPPERTYYRKAKAEERVGTSGEGYIDQILEWEHQKAPEFNKLISILKKLELIHSLKTKQLKGGRFEINVKTKSKGVWASLTDVGFGISQFLPIIVADLQLGIAVSHEDYTTESTLILAQPEIHLHPSVQASLADYFVNQIKETGKQYIIETHSEYFLNRLRLDIVKGKLDPADISVYYFEPSPDGSITYRIEFTKDGQIKNAPKGFFDTYFIDTMDIALYA